MNAAAEFVYVDESHMVRSWEILIEARVQNKPD